MSVTPDGILILVKFVQSRNAYALIFVILSGNFTLVRFSHAINVDLAIPVIPSSISTDLISFFPAKFSVLITPVPSITSLPSVYKV